MTSEVLLGWSCVDVPHAVRIPIRHMVVAGQTQEAGKTTTLEALIARSGLTAIAFVTKRGEGSFAGARRIKPYFRDRADWQFVASILEATMRERMKFERSWIIQASKGAKTLADVQVNVRKALKTARGISEGVYTSLDAYLEIVVPRIERIDFQRGDLDLAPGLNVVDLSDRNTFPAELQALVMRSVIEWVYENAEGTITVIPEAWEFLPQSRGSPVKLAATELIRKGAGLRNYVWLDSQDIGGIDKEILRSCPVWLLGVQRERNEIKRTLDNIPNSTAKPKPSAIAMLERGQFYACHGKHSTKAYVQPIGMLDSTAIAIASGKANHDLYIGIKPRPLPAAPPPSSQLRQPVRPYEQPPATDEDDLMTAENGKKLDRIIELLEERAPTSSSTKPAAAAPASATSVDVDDLYLQIRARLLKDPKVLQILAQRPVLEISETIEKIAVDGKTLRGRLAQLLGKGFFDQPRTANAAYDELKRLGFGTAKPSVYRECDKLAELGFLTKEDSGYQVVAEMKINVVRG